MCELYMIQCIQISTLEFSSNVIGNSSMVKSRKQFLPTPLHQEEKQDVDLHMFVDSNHAGDKLT